jgi:hypothetical protein
MGSLSFKQGLMLTLRIGMCQFIIHPFYRNNRIVTDERIHHSIFSFVIKSGQLGDYKVLRFYQ